MQKTADDDAKDYGWQDGQLYFRLLMTENGCSKSVFLNDKWYFRWFP